MTARSVVCAVPEWLFEALSVELRDGCKLVELREGLWVSVGTTLFVADAACDELVTAVS